MLESEYLYRSAILSRAHEAELLEKKHDDKIIAEIWAVLAMRRQPVGGL